MVKIWGANAAEYVGKSLTLYNDPNVTFGRDKVGGIRISHMSHIDAPQSILLTITRAMRKLFTVKPLFIDKPKAISNPFAVKPLFLDEPNGNQASAEMQVIDSEALIANARSTAAGGTDIYREWYSGIGSKSQIILNETQEPDSEDFDKMKAVHEICKAIAARADNQSDNNY